MYRNLYRYRYIVCTDLDEMIVPASPHHNYTEMLGAAAAAAARANAVIHSYVFRNTYFFLDFGATQKEPWYLLTQRCSTMCVRSRSNTTLLYYRKHKLRYNKLMVTNSCVVVFATLTG